MTEVLEGGTIDLDAEPSPYVGPRSIGIGEPIYGRDRETAELVDTLISARIVLLYSPSGAGKSSLVAAGVTPALSERGFGVLPPLRVGADPLGAPGNRYIRSVAQSIAEARGLPDPMANGSFGDAGLAEWVSSCRDDLVDDGEDLCLVLDQFEEIFTLDPTDQVEKREFFTELGRLMRDRSTWVLVSMREDFIAQLDPYLALIPTRFNTRYRLDLLDVESAREAVRRPALNAGAEFTVEAAARLVDDLRRVQVRRGDEVSLELGPHVEPVQLQVVCRRLWRKVTS